MSFFGGRWYLMRDQSNCSLRVSPTCVKRRLLTNPNFNHFSTPQPAIKRLVGQEDQK